LLDEGLAAQVRQTMSRHVGVLRTPEGLAHACDTLSAIADKTSSDITPSRASFEATNILTAAVAVAHAAAARKESRGCHRRSDVTTPDESRLIHLDVSLHDGEVRIAEVMR
jgi:L-aspartate oxidase